MKNVFIVLAVVLGFLVTGQGFALDAAKSVTTTTLETPAPASTVSGSTLSAPAPSENKAVSTMKKIDDAIPGDLAVWILAALAFLAEIAMRFFPTFRPKSLLLMLASLFTSIGSIFTKLSNLLDKVAQNIKEEKKP